MIIINLLLSIYSRKIWLNNRVMSTSNLWNLFISFEGFSNWSTSRWFPIKPFHMNQIIMVEYNKITDIFASFYFFSSNIISPWSPPKTDMNVPTVKSLRDGNFYFITNIFVLFCYKITKLNCKYYQFTSVLYLCTRLIELLEKSTWMIG